MIDLEQAKKICACIPFADANAGLTETAACMRGLIGEVEELRAVAARLPGAVAAAERYLSTSKMPDEAKAIARETIALVLAEARVEIDRLRGALTYIARNQCRENPPCSSRIDYACDACHARAALGRLAAVLGKVDT